MVYLISRAAIMSISMFVSLSMTFYKDSSKHIEVKNCRLEAILSCPKYGQHEVKAGSTGLYSSFQNYRVWQGNCEKTNRQLKAPVFPRSLTDFS
ncbi:hypothetical protein RRG08_044089 [Elysia crispata]|nr:hypothetical protein RRG08_044089 [Elysia crispata]